MSDDVLRPIIRTNRLQRVYAWLYVIDKVVTIAACLLMVGFLYMLLSSSEDRALFADILSEPILAFIALCMVSLLLRVYVYVYFATLRQLEPTHVVGIVFDVVMIACSAFAWLHFEGFVSLL